MLSATHPHIKHLAGYTPKHQHLSPSSLQVPKGHLFDLAQRNRKGDLKRPTLGGSMGSLCQRDKERKGKVERERSVSVIKSASEELPFSMGYILYKLSNLHTWELRLRE